jgi:hypothetical protein
LNHHTAFKFLPDETFRLRLVGWLGVKQVLDLLPPNALKLAVDFDEVGRDKRKRDYREDAQGVRYSLSFQSWASLSGGLANLARLVSAPLCF